MKFELNAKRMTLATVLALGLPSPRIPDRAGLCRRLPGRPGRRKRHASPAQTMPKDVTDEVISSIDLSSKGEPGRATCCASASSSCSPAASCRGMSTRPARPTS